MFFSLLIHEYGHALTALFFGASPWITLEALGGRAEYNGYGMTPKQQFLITLNGPLLQTLLIFIPYALLKSGNFENHYYIHYLLSATMQLNIVWCLLNLLPIIPLDGGRLLHYILAGKFGEKGARASILIGLLFATIATPYLFFHGYTFFAVLIAMMGLQNLQILQQIKNPSSTSTPFANYQNALKAIDNNELEKAKTLLKKLLKTKDSKVKHLSTEALAKLHYQQNEKEQAYELLVKTDPEQIREAKPLLCKLAYEKQNYPLIAQHARDIYQIEPTYEIALLNSKTFAHLNQPNPSGGWLLTASQFGPDQRQDALHQLTQHPYLALKDHPHFQTHTTQI